MNENNKENIIRKGVKVIRIKLLLLTMCYLAPAVVGKYYRDYLESIDAKYYWILIPLYTLLAVIFAHAVFVQTICPRCRKGFFTRNYGVFPVKLLFFKCQSCGLNLFRKN